MNSRESIRPSEIDTQLKDDPRIDSPEIVVRPVATEEIPVVEPIVEITEPPTQEPEKETHECKVGFQDAIKQNWLPILGTLVGAFLLGVLLGKKL